MNSFNSQKGFVDLVVIFWILIIGSLATIIIFFDKSVNSPINLQPSLKTPLPTPTISPIIPKIEEIIPPPALSNTNSPQPYENPSPTPKITGSLSSPIPQKTFSVEIKGDNSCVPQTEQALNLLKEKASIHYDIITKYVGVIECSDSGSGMYAWENPPRYQVGKSTRDAGVIWYAGTIAHDSCHSKQYHDYLSNNPSGSVPDDVWTGREAERQCLDVQYDALTKIDADQATLDYVRNSINSEYWNVGYSNVWW